MVSQESKFSNERIHTRRDDEEMQASKHMAVHPVRRSAAARHTTSRTSNNLSLDSNYLSSNIGLNPNQIYNNRKYLNQLAHEDKDSSQQPRAKTGYNGLTDENQRQRLIDISFNRSGTSSTPRIFGRLNEQNSFRSESKGDFANDGQFVNNRLRTIVELSEDKEEGDFIPINYDYSREASAANDGGLMSSLGTGVRALGESRVVAGINRVGDAFSTNVIDGINVAGDALNENVVTPMFNALAEAFVTPAVNGVNNARAEFSNGEYNSALDSAAGVVVAVAQFIPVGEGIAAAEALGAQVARFGIFGQRLSRLETSAYEFKPGQDVVHFNKHYEHITSKFGLENYTIEEYINDAKLVIKTGQYVPELHAYVTIPGGTSEARVLFVGLDRQTNEITTMHLRKIADLEKSAPSLGWSYRTSIEPRDLIGPNEQLGYKPPYRRN